jgi:hypothetical protein
MSDTWNEALLAWAKNPGVVDWPVKPRGNPAGLKAWQEKRRCGECGGFRTRCKKCKSKSAKEKYATSLDVRLGNRDRHLRRTYGITLLEYDAMLARQSGKCAACFDALVAGKTTHVDHCHETKKVRGILCHKCNVTLGNSGEDSLRLRSIANYIDRHRLTADRQDLDCPTRGVIGHRNGVDGK